MNRYMLKPLVLGLSFVFLAACLGVTLTAPDMPAKMFKPSKVKMTTINGVKLGLPAGWKNNPKITKNYKASDTVVLIEHKKLGEMVIMKKPFMGDARYGKIVVLGLVPEVMPDAERVTREMSLPNRAIMQIFRGTFTVGGRRMPFRMYTAYNIDGGTYHMYANMPDTKENKRLYNDFIAVANSIR
ncbi:MAG: hypothetical protein OEY52_08930 [Gammaproteobacteria bacterium]|nr:hypothetical protein [Gammaproteobacteria bacterium]